MSDGDPTGLISAGVVPSGLSTTKLLRPLPESSSAVTVMLAAATEDNAKTDRAIPEWAATLNSSASVGAGSELVFLACRKEAQPPAGWLAMLSRKVLSWLVRFCRTTTKALCKVRLSGFEFCGADSDIPSVIRLK